MKFRQWLTATARMLDRLGEDIDDSERRTVDGFRKEVYAYWRDQNETIVALLQRVKTLEQRPTEAAMTYETVNVGGGAVETIGEPMRPAVRGADYSTALGNVNGWSKS